MMTHLQTPSKTEPMFSAIARRYDLCNHLFSFGLDFSWRKTAVRLACPERVEKVLDLCCGTGDMAFALAKSKKVGHILGSDICQPMLAIAQEKQAKQSIRDVHIDWLCAPAEKTGLADASFDLVTCAFGLRNVDNLAAALNEMYRVLKPGGRVCILDFFLPQNKLMRSGYLFYLCHVMPMMARWIAKTSEPWNYLADSIQRWEKIDLAEQLYLTGFRDLMTHSLTSGTIHIHLGIKATNAS